MSDDVGSDVAAWLACNWDPDLTVAEWWERLCDSHWAVPTWPEESFGRALSRGDAGVVADAMAAAGALGPPGGLGVMLAGPTIVAHGSDVVSIALGMRASLPCHRPAGSTWPPPSGGQPRMIGPGFPETWPGSTS